MDDLIKRSTAIRALNREKSDWNCDYNVPIDNCIKRLNKVKSADRPQGKWVPFITNYYKCSLCGKEMNVYLMQEYNFCPNCGCRMRGDKNDQ